MHPMTMAAILFVLLCAASLAGNLHRDRENAMDSVTKTKEMILHHTRLFISFCLMSIIRRPCLLIAAPFFLLLLLAWITLYICWMGLFHITLALTDMMLALHSLAGPR